MNYNTIIIDNEIPHLRHLRNLLEEHFKSYHIMAECKSVPEGVEAIRKCKPDLIFLDIEMHPHTGFDLLKELSDMNFEVIFTTSHNEYAIQAIKFSALDYLLKPFDEEDLRQALIKFEAKKHKEDSRRQYENLLSNLQQQHHQQQRITLASVNGMEFFKVEEIIRCESENVYTTFFLTNNRKVVVSKPIGDWEELLEPFNFCRVHNQHLINLAHLRKYIKGEGGIAIMTDGKEVDISRRKKEVFISKLGSI